jgi:hypothetical protein
MKHTAVSMQMSFPDFRFPNLLLLKQLAKLLTTYSLLCNENPSSIIIDFYKRKRTSAL